MVTGWPNSIFSNVSVSKYLCVSVGGGGPLRGFPFFSTQAW